MLRFRLGAIPVEVRPTHLLIAAWLAWSFMLQNRPGLEATQMVVLLLAGMMVVFVSILVHELGHAVAAKAFGYQPAIVIEWFGGHTTPNAPGPIPWLKDVVLTLAGPLFGLGLGIAAIVTLGMLDAELLSLSAADPVHVQVLRFFGLANLAWAVLNLIPVLPLDGGRISHAVLTRIFGRHGVLFSQGLALVLCVAMLAWGASSGNLLLVVFFGMWGWGAVQHLMAYFKGRNESADAMATPNAADLAFAQAATLFHGGKLEEARRIAERTLAGETPVPPESRQRLRHLLGWVALKEGRGDEALDHFSAVGAQVEPHALAAAWSLAGDDAKAVPLWELAARETNDLTVKHEWAGALLRMGRVDAARRVPGVDPVEAWRRAEAVPLQRGDFTAAARLGEDAVRHEPKPELAYNAACAWARAGDTERAKGMLERAAELGFRDASYAQADADLAAVRQRDASWFDGWLRRLQSAPR